MDLHSRVARRIALGCILLTCALTLTEAASAQTRVREQTSLRLIPDDAALYGASFRLKEQFQAFTRSKAFARFCNLPLVQDGFDELKKAFEEGFLGAATEEDEEDDAKEKPAKKENSDSEEAADPQAQLREFYSFLTDPNTQKVMALVLDALSHEVFVYGDKSAIGFAREVRKLNLDMNRLAFDGTTGDRAQALQKIQPLLDRLDALPVPAFALGFKTTNAAGVTEQMAALESWLREALSEYPKVVEGLHREKIGGGEFLTLTLDGSQVPWKELIDDDNKPDSDSDDADADADDDSDEKMAREIIEKLSAKLKDRRLTFTLGVAEGYVLVSFGETNAHLARLFEKDKRLADRLELAPLLKFPDSPFTGISYTSAELSGQIHDSSNAAESLRDGLDRLGPLLGLDEEARNSLLKDVQDLTNEAARLGANPGAVVTWSYQTPLGFEGLSYDYSGGSRSLDGSKPLSILGHLGASPLVVAASRQKNQAPAYEFVARSMRVAAFHLDRIATPYIPPPYGLFYTRLKEEFEPVVKEFHKITTEQLIPSVADGQSAFVLEAQPLKLDVLPEHDALPFPLPALVYGVTDMKLLQTACGGYFNLLQQGLTILNRVFPDEVPPFVIPSPAERKAGDLRLFVYPITGEEGSSGELAATAAIGKDFAVLSLAPTQAKELLIDRGFSSSGVLKRADRPAARVWVVNVAELMKISRAWVDFAIESDPTFFSSDEPEAAAETIRGVLEFIGCWRGSAGIQYVEEGALVHHYESQFEDLK
jgi:hypothetical protein